MDLVSFESEIESDKMLELCSKNADLFETHTYAGALTNKGASMSDWYWVNSGKQINHKMKFGPDEPNNHNGEEYCMSIVRVLMSTEFHYNDINCSSGEKPFMCQKSLM